MKTMNSNRDNATVDQHFIPKMYLNGFAEVKSKDIANTWQFDVKTFQYIPNRPTRTDEICKKRNLYELRNDDGGYIARNVIEEAFGRIETKAGVVFKSVILRAQTETCMNCSSFLSEEEKSVLVIFITSLMYRNPETIEAGVKFLINENPEISFSRASNFTRLNLLPLGIDKSWDEKTIIRTALKNLEGMAFQVGVTEGDVFFTSDRPVIQYPSYNDNFPYTPKAVIFPLTSRIVLYLYPKEDVSQTAQNCLFQLDQERIRAIQHNISVYARRWIYSRKPLTEEQVFIIKAAREKMPDL